MKHNKKWKLIFILILLGILFFEMVFYVQKKYTLPTFTYGTTTESETKEGTPIVGAHISVGEDEITY